MLRSVTLQIRTGEHVAVLGPNGAGKSTLLALLSRALYPSSGTVRVLGRERWDVHELRSQLGVVSAALEGRLVPESTVREAVLSGFLGDLGHYRAEDLPAGAAEATEAALDQVEIAHLAHRPLPTLSSGERRRAMLARALAHRPSTMVLDEPTSSLDLASRHRFLDLLAKLMDQGLNVLLVTHHLEELLPGFGRVILLREGGVFADGPREAVMSSESLSRCFGLPLCLRGDGPYTAEVRR